MHAFFSWLVEQEYLPLSPMQKIKALPEERRAKEFLDDDEVMRILKMMDKSYFPELRDLVICDEMHNLIKYRGIEKSNNKRALVDENIKEQTCCQNALKAIASIGRAQENAPLLVIMTATNNAVSEFFDIERVPVKYLDYTDQVHSDATLRRVYYSDLCMMTSMWIRLCSWRMYGDSDECPLSLPSAVCYMKRAYSNRCFCIAGCRKHL